MLITDIVNEYVKQKYVFIFHSHESMFTYLVSRWYWWECIIDE